MKKTIHPVRVWSSVDRPDHKLYHLGKQHMTDAELLSLVMVSGTREESSLSLSQRILADHQFRLSELGCRSVAELVQRYPDLGCARASRLVASLELGRRRREQGPSRRTCIRSSADCFEFLRPMLGDLAYEEFWVVLLNTAAMVIHAECVGRGGLQAVTADVRRILKVALDFQATSLILAHNHPSGTLRPSDEDIRFTITMKEATSLIRIQLTDHLILSDWGYYSFLDQGML